MARRSPGEYGSKDANTRVRSVQTRRGWVGAAGATGRVARRRGPRRRAGCGRPSVEVLPEEERRARVLLGGALARGLLQRAKPAFYTAGSGAACCSDVGSVCAFQNSETSLEC